MKTPLKLTLFGASLLLIFAAALGAGRIAGPAGLVSQDDDMHGADHNQSHPESTAQAGAVPGGVQIAQDGYRLNLASTTLSTADTEALRFTVIGPDGKPVTDYTKAHDKDLHLIVVRRDLTGFQHLHPVLGNDGVWSIPLRVDHPGAYRVFADFQPAARDTGLILGADATAPGNYQPRPLPAPTRTAVVDGYTIALDGDLVPGTASKLTLTVTKDGAPVTDLQPYLGAFGHLVALRDGDLAYLHVHPEPSAAAGPQIVFYADVPSSGSYGLFLDFARHDVVRTAAFTATTHHSTAPAADPTPSASGHGHD